MRRDDEAVLSERGLQLHQLVRYFDHPPPCRRFLLDERRGYVAGMGKREKVSLARVRDDELGGIGDELDVPAALAGIEDMRMSDQGEHGLVVIERVHDGAVPLFFHVFANGLEHSPIRRGQIIKLGILGAKALHRHRAAGCPCAALVHLLQGLDLTAARIEQEGQPLAYLINRRGGAPLRPGSETRSGGRAPVPISA